MNKTAIKNFAVWARRKLMEDTRLKANSLGISGENIAEKMEHSTKEVHFFEIGMEKPLELTGTMLRQRTALAKLIDEKSKTSDLATAFEIVVEEVAYTWFNRLIALRFMEVNDYLPSGLRVLSSITEGKSEPDLVTNPFSADFSYTNTEQTFIEELQDKGDSDGLFAFLFVKQCNALNDILPKLFEKTADYTELLLNLSYIKEDSVVSRLVHDIPEEDFREAVEIVGWLYQYYNIEPKEKVFADLKKNVKISKENIPAATQLFTPDWIVKYMVENSLGRLWLEQNPESPVRENWKYYLEEAPQSPEVTKKLVELGQNHPVSLEEIKFLDPCMGSGHILVYAFEVLMELYLSQGSKARKAVENILKFNLYGLDIDKRAYQLAYFAVMMKARQHDSRVFSRGLSPMVYAPVNHEELENFGSLYKVEELPPEPQEEDFLPLDLLTYTLEERQQNWSFLYVLSQKHEVVCTNPPYMGGSNGNGKLADFMKKEFPDSKGDLFAVFIEKCFAFAKDTGFLAMITQHSFMFLSSYEKLRGKLLQKDFINMAHLGARAFEEIGGEVVQTTSFVMRNQKIEGYQSSFARLVDFNSQQEKENEFLMRNHLHTAQQENFSKIPGSPIAYWVSEKICDLYANPNLKDFTTAICKGCYTGNNEKYLRLWTEVSYEKIEKGIWHKYSKGGRYRKWYGNSDRVILWEQDGKELKSEKSAGMGASKYYGMEHIVWSGITTYKPSFRQEKKSVFFDDVSPALIFSDYSDQLKYQSYILAYCNSNVVEKLLNITNPTMHYQAGDVRAVPIKICDKNYKDLREEVFWCMYYSKNDWDEKELSWDFSVHPLNPMFMVDTESEEKEFVAQNGFLLENCFQSYKIKVNERFKHLKANEENINKYFIDKLDLQGELSPDVETRDVTVSYILTNEENDDELLKNPYVLREKDIIKSLLSYAVGCIFGRYSIYKEGLCLTGEDIYAENFCAKLKYNNNLFLRKHNEENAELFSPVKENCLVICEEHFDGMDLCSHVIKFLEKMYGYKYLEENLNYIARALGTKGDTSRDCINNYFLKEFYKDHLKTYQKRPIYWEFDSGKEGGFKALMYIHRYHQDNLGVIRTNYLHKMQSVYGEMIRSAEYDLQYGGKNIKVLEKLQRKLAESTNYEVKLAHLANRRIDLDLDDGVKVNYEKLQTGQDGKKIDVLGKI